MIVWIALALVAVAFFTGGWFADACLTLAVAVIFGDMWRRHPRGFRLLWPAGAVLLVAAWLPASWGVAATAVAIVYMLAVVGWTRARRR